MATTEVGSEPEHTIEDGSYAQYHGHVRRHYASDVVEEEVVHRYDEEHNYGSQEASHHFDTQEQQRHYITKNEVPAGVNHGGRNHEDHQHQYQRESMATTANSFDQVADEIADDMEVFEQVEEQDLQNLAEVIPERNHDRLFSAADPAPGPSGSGARTSQQIDEDVREEGHGAHAEYYGTENEQDDHDHGYDGDADHHAHHVHHGHHGHEQYEQDDHDQYDHGEHPEYGHQEEHRQYHDHDHHNHRGGGDIDSDHHEHHHGHGHHHHVHHEDDDFNGVEDAHEGGVPHGVHEEHDHVENLETREFVTGQSGFETQEAESEITMPGPPPSFNYRGERLSRNVADAMAMIWDKFWSEDVRQIVRIIKNRFGQLMPYIRRFVAHVVAFWGGITYIKRAITAFVRLLNRDERVRELLERLGWACATTMRVFLSMCTMIMQATLQFYHLMRDRVIPDIRRVIPILYFKIITRLLAAARHSPWSIHLGPFSLTFAIDAAKVPDRYYLHDRLYVPRDDVTFASMRDLVQSIRQSVYRTRYPQPSDETVSTPVHTNSTDEEPVPPPSDYDGPRNRESKHHCQQERLSNGPLSERTNIEHDD